ARGGCIGIAWLLAAFALCAGAAPAVADPPAPVYTVPSTIASDCSAPVEGELMDWLATVPDGSTVQFASNGCYGQDGTITVSGRHALTLDGNGSEFRTLTPGARDRANWRFVGG